jgi:hypothetical protein
MTTTYPSKKDSSAKKVSSKLSARTVNDIKNFEIRNYIEDHQADLYGNKTDAWMLSGYIARHYNPKRGYAYPSIPYMAKKWNKSERQMKRLIRQIREAVDINGNPLWTIVRGNNMGEETVANRYTPNFLGDILEAAAKKDDDAAASESNQEQGDVTTEDPTVGMDESTSDLDEAVEYETEASHNLFEEDEPTEPEEDIEDSEEVFGSESDVEFESENVSDSDAEPEEATVTLDYSFLLEPAVERQQLNKRIILPAWVPSDAEAMMTKAKDSLAYKKGLEKEMEGKGITTPFSLYTHKMPPIVASEGFRSLSQEDRLFLSQLLFYVSENGPAMSQHYYDKASGKLVRRWYQSGLSNPDFYLTFMKGFAKEVPHLDLM